MANDTLNADIENPGTLGDDAMKWAVAFCQAKERNGWSLDDIDQGLMVGWFANAIEVAHDARASTKAQGSSQTHTIIEYANGGSGYLEMTCWQCGDVHDLVDFQRIDWLDAATQDFDMPCPGCEHLGSVKNETPST